MGDITSQSSIARHDANSAMMSISSKILVVTVIIVFLMLALLFIVHIYAKWYWSRHVHEDSRIVSWRRRTALAHQGPAGARTRGLDSRALELVPEVEFDPKEFHEGLECAVCLSEVTLGEKIRLLPKCNHGFHVTCIDMWFHSHTTCPLCRTPVVFDQNNIHLQEIEVSSSSESESESDSETRVRSFRQPSEEASTSTTSSGNELVIDIPRQVFCEDCLSSPRLGDNCDGESSKSPVLTTLRSFRRLLSRGKRVVPSPHGLSSVETEQV